MATRTHEPGSGPDRTLRAAMLSVAAAAVLLSGGALAGWGPRAAAGVAIGGALATANLVVLARIVDAFVSLRGRTAPWAIIAALKLVALLAGVWLILRSGVVSGLSLALGYCALPVGITLGSLFGPRPSEPEASEPGPDEAPATTTTGAGGQTPENTSDADVLEAGRREPGGPAQ